MKTTKIVITKLHWCIVVRVGANDLCYYTVYLRGMAGFDAFTVKFGDSGSKALFRKRLPAECRPRPRGVRRVRRCGVFVHHHVLSLHETLVLRHRRPTASLHHRLSTELHCIAVDAPTIAICTRHASSH